MTKLAGCLVNAPAIAFNVVVVLDAVTDLNQQSSQAFLAINQSYISQVLAV